MPEDVPYCFHFGPHAEGELAIWFVEDAIKAGASDELIARVLVKRRNAQIPWEKFSKDDKPPQGPLHAVRTIRGELLGLSELDANIRALVASFDRLIRDVKWGRRPRKRRRKRKLST